MATKKLETTCGELVDLMNGHFGVQDVPGKDFALIISRNMKVLQKTLEHVEKVGKPSEEFLKFAQNMNKLQQANAKEALEETGIDTFQGWSEGNDGRQRVSFESFVLPLIKAVQELSKKV